MKTVYYKPLILWTLSLLFFAVYRPFFLLGKATDFERYWASFQILSLHQNPFDLHALSRMTQFEWGGPAYASPWLYLLIAPVLCLPLASATYVWIVINTGLFFSILGMTWRTLSNKPCPWATLFFITIPFFPVVINFYSGQLGLLSAFGFTGCLYMIHRGKDRLAGCFFVLMTLKPHVVYLLMIAWVVWIFQNKKYRFLFSCIFCQLIVMGLTAWMFPTIYQNWLVVLKHATHHATSTLPSLLRAWVYGSEQFQDTVFLWAMPLGMIFSTLYYFRKRKIIWQKHLPILLCLSVWTAPYGFSFDFSVLVILLIIIGAQASSISDGFEKRLIYLRVAAMHTCSWGLWILLLPDQSGYAWIPPLTFWVWHRNNSRNIDFQPMI